MESISRRGFVISAAAAGAVFGLNGPVEFLSSALAQGSSDALKQKGYAKFKIGDVQVTQIYDGVLEKPHDPNFIKNATVDQTKDALKAAGQPTDFVPITFTVTVVEIGGRTIMFDSSTGGQTGGPKAGLVVKENMAKAGIDPAKISTILVTHFHGDHIFGLMSKEGNAPVYPNAEILVPETEYKFWTDASNDKLPPYAKRIQATFPTWKNVKQIAPGQDVAAGIRSLDTRGHTVGHTSYQIGSGAQQLIVLGDVTNLPALNVRNPGWHLVFDANAQLAEENRRKIFDRAVADKITVTGYHFGMPGAGTIEKDGSGYVFVPVSV